MGSSDLTAHEGKALTRNGGAARGIIDEIGEKKKMKKPLHRKIIGDISWLLQSLASEGVSKTIALAKTRIHKKHMKRRRREIAQEIANALSYKVAHGPFAGMSILREQFWGCDQATKCLGLYEQQTLKRLQSAAESRNRKTFIDIGGADGYFAVGCLVSGMFERAIVFEMDARGRENIKRAAEANGVLERLEIHKEATPDSLKQVVSRIEPENCMFLVDIEGAEFGLFTPKLLNDLSKSELIIELHDFEPGRQKTKRYLESITSHAIEVFRSGPRDPRAFAELDHLDDNDCWLLMTEGRGGAMDWAHLKPLN
jgi:hypothetical protein